MKPASVSIFSPLTQTSRESFSKAIRLSDSPRRIFQTSNFLLLSRTKRSSSFYVFEKISYVYSKIGLNDFYGHFEIVKSKHLSHFRSFTHGLNPFPLFYRWQLWTKKSNMESRTGNKELRHGRCHTGQSDTAWLSLI